jgi:DNA-directed RNA polymerase subunit K/omega
MTKKKTEYSYFEDDEEYNNASDDEKSTDTEDEDEDDDDDDNQEQLEQDDIEDDIEDDIDDDDDNEDDEEDNDEQNGGNNGQNEDDEENDEDGNPIASKSKKSKKIIIKKQDIKETFSSDDDDDDDDDSDLYLKKFDKEINDNYIVNFHPECALQNYDEISAMTKVVRDENGIIIDDLHKTIPYLTKYEKARILGQRAKQINSGAIPFVKVPENVIDGYLIAELELQQKRIPFIIRRPLPNGGSEYWNLKDLENISF